MHWILTGERNAFKEHRTICRGQQLVGVVVLVEAGTGTLKADGWQPPKIKGRGHVLSFTPLTLPCSPSINTLTGNLISCICGSTACQEQRAAWRTQREVVVRCCLALGGQGLIVKGGKGKLLCAPSSGRVASAPGPLPEEALHWLRH